MYPVEGVASRITTRRHTTGPVHVGERNPQLEHWIAWLRHAADAPDRITAKVGELGGIGLAVEYHDTKHMCLSGRQAIGCPTRLVRWHLDVCLRTGVVAGNHDHSGYDASAGGDASCGADAHVGQRIWR